MKRGSSPLIFMLSPFQWWFTKTS